MSTPIFTHPVIRFRNMIRKKITVSHLFVDASSLDERPDRHRIPPDGRMMQCRQLILVLGIDVGPVLDQHPHDVLAHLALAIVVGGVRAPTGLTWGSRRGWGEGCGTSRGAAEFVDGVLGGVGVDRGAALGAEGAEGRHRALLRVPDGELFCE